jgi:hypothetical protein
MKSNFFASLAIATFLSSVSFAQFSNSNTSSYKPDETVSGVKLSLMIPMLFAKVTAKATDLQTGISDSASTRDSVDTLGFGVGYSYVPVESIGFTGQVSFLTIDNDTDAEDVRILRYDANATYGLNEMVYLKGGLNYADITNSELKEFKGSVGVQIGMGFQFSKNVGLDLNYGLMTFSNNLSEEGVVDAKAEIELSGLELGLTATF